jgi:hypothetical protein
VLAKSEEYKKGDKWQKMPDRLDSWEDGIAARWHPHALRPATEEEKHDVRETIIVNTDDIEVRAR